MRRSRMVRACFGLLTAALVAVIPLHAAAAATPQGAVDGTVRETDSFDGFVHWSVTYTEMNFFGTVNYGGRTYTGGFWINGPSFSGEYAPPDCHLPSSCGVVSNPGDVEGPAPLAQPVALWYESNNTPYQAGTCGAGSVGNSSSLDLVCTLTFDGAPGATTELVVPDVHDVGTDNFVASFTTS